MKALELKLQRDVLSDDFTLGKLYVDNKFFAHTCEDRDRKLEAGGVKVATRTAIPRGRYKVVVSFSQRFQKPLPQVLDVPGFTGIRIHGGNTAEDTEGCVLVGKVRTTNGVARCAERLSTLIDLLTVAEDGGRDAWLEVA